MSKAIPGVDSSFGQALPNSQLWEEFANYNIKGKKIDILPPHLIGANTGTGSTGGAYQSFYFDSGADAASTSRLTQTFLALQDESDVTYIPWNKKMLILISAHLTTTDANQVAYYGLTEADAHATLSAPGIRISIANLAISGDTYGASGDTVNLSTNLVADKVSWIAIYHDPTVPKIDWYVNWVYKASQTTSAKIPQAAGSATGYFVASLTNGATASARRGWVHGGTSILVKA